MNFMSVEQFWVMSLKSVWKFTKLNIVNVNRTFFLCDNSELCVQLGKRSDGHRDWLLGRKPISGDKSGETCCANANFCASPKTFFIEESAYLKQWGAEAVNSPKLDYSMPFLWQLVGIFASFGTCFLSRFCENRIVSLRSTWGWLLVE